MVGYRLQADMACIADYRDFNCLLLPCINYREKTMRIIIDVFRVQKNIGEELFSII